MTPIECAFEQDVIDAVATERWPDRCDEELRAHIASCAICADLAEVGTALRGEGEEARDEASPPVAGLVWWRAQVRAREEAARAAARPIRVVQGAAVAALAGLTAAVVGATSAPVQRWATWIASLSPGDLLPSGLPIAAAVIQRGLLLGAITWIALASLALYLTFVAEE